MKIIHVVGARPNFMKVAPVHRAISIYPNVKQILIHTGQHYDVNMSDIFFQQLGLPAPDVNLEVGSGSHAVQTAQIMMRFEETVLRENPDLVLVYGDVNSTVAAALVCAKLGIRVGHVEAGLRSFDRTMPEEINRLMTDQIADYLFTPSQDGDANLLREGVAKEKIHFVGNVMIDTLVRLLPKAGGLWPQLSADLKIEEKKYCLVTLHRPSNVDDPTMLKQIIETLGEISRDLPIVFPIHPRTRERIAANKIKIRGNGNLQLTDPIGYLDFLCLQQKAKLVITDSGGIQEETTYLGVPCLTVRDNTERPVTVDVGTNTLVGQDMALLREETRRVLDGKERKGMIPPLWEGKAGARIAEIVSRI
ncbi:MAG: UDP-N-acetylglucosamine 2-epimerase (non-hydrolyzing) [Candidatus Vecturithrix sp.]|jgi:UDP-N-acetylglucosamine 2-epimerase (non-hydrolysing)|nr:UDP-N-acetylglucosamine 2-epimerase (non-hydrolyzing) [Candidatus Vecturithrix sp.]